MGKLESIQYDKFMAVLRAQAADHERGKAAFESLRNKYQNHLASLIRLHHQTETYVRHGLLPDTVLRHIDGNFHLWCEAAYMLTGCAPLDIQQEFLLAPQNEKDRMVSAVIEDGGLHELDGHWRELVCL
jgi:hypothetical protein